MKTLLALLLILSASPSKAADPATAVVVVAVTGLIINIKAYQLCDRLEGTWIKPTPGVWADPCPDAQWRYLFTPAPKGN